MTKRDPSTLDRRGFLTAACAALGAAGLARLGFGDEPSSSPAGAAETRRPNFVIIFTDDQGYQDLGCYGSPNIATPRIDRLAAEGMRFTDFHSASPVCTPSRAALLTGCYPARLSLEKGVLFPKSHRGLNPDEVTLAKLLKPLGYATACIGKWHLGDAPEFLPLKHGFDSYFGIPYSNDMRPCCLMRDNEVIEEAVALDTLTERYTAAAVKFIGDHKDQPFFLYLPHTMPHTPLAASPKFAGKSKRGLYGDVVETIDWSTGEILDAIKAAGMDERTCVIFASDNGPWLIRKEHGGAALPLRDGKGTTWEGGHRVPCIVRWPGKVPAGKVCGEFATTMDLYPTLATMAGAKLPADRVVDGKDIGALLAGKAGAQTPHEYYFHYSTGGQLEAVRGGRWKLFRRDPVELYDLVVDLGETTNVAGQRPEVVSRLEQAAAAFEGELATTRRAVGISQIVPPPQPKPPKSPARKGRP